MHSTGDVPVAVVGQDGPMESPASVPLTAGVRPPGLREGDVLAPIRAGGPGTARTARRRRRHPAMVGAKFASCHTCGRCARDAYLAGDDKAPAEDFSTAWAAPDVRAIVYVRGGYGTQRMTDLVDWSALRGVEPTVLVGYSDVTALQQAVAAHLGVVTLHGPMTATRTFLDSPAAQAHLRTTLFEPEAVQALAPPAARPLVGGTAVGVTTGGCLSVLSMSVATPSALMAGGGLVLLEDVNEKSYRIDSYLTHLRRSGWFEGAAGIVLGSWVDCEPAEPVVLDVLGDLGVPILGDLGFGHGEDPITVPLGVLAELDADAGRLTLDQPALA